MDIKSAEERSRNMSRIHSRNTKPEIRFRKWLFDDGYRYVLNSCSVPGHPDLWMPKYNTAVFINGCFWHRHANCKYAYSPKSNEDFWEKKFQNNINRDHAVQLELRNKGIRYLIVWECTIQKMDHSEQLRTVILEKAEAFLQSTEISLIL